MVHLYNKRAFLLFLCWFLFNLMVNAASYYADPSNGSMSNTGASSSPWSSLEDVMNSSITFSAGDIIFLRTGNHGFPKINKVNTGYVEIRPQSGHNPIIDRIYIGNNPSASYWKLNGLTVQIENVAAFPISLITLYPSSSNIIVENCTIQSTDNTTNYTRNDWRDKTNHGIRSQGNGHTIIDNSIQNIAVGLSIESENTLISNNTIQYFTIDGIRGLASDCIYEKNTIKDNVAVFIYSENHYDGFQAYTCCPVGADTLKNVILRKNLIINCTDTTRQWRGPMQGMAGFDGYFENWTIENNIIITDHWHGITLLGALNCRIINNTVVDPYDITPIDPFDPQSVSNSGPAWIKIAAHKNNNPSLNNTVRNNLTADIQNDIGIGIVDSNIVIGSSNNYSSYFVNYSAFDYHLLSSSTAIDVGNSNLAPLNDFDNNPRPSGLGIDVGAYEYQLITSISDFQTNNSLKIYPNPSSRFVEVKTKNVIKSIKIFNDLGQELFSESFTKSKSENIDFSKFGNGLYFIIVKTIQNEIFTKKIIISLH